MALDKGDITASGGMAKAIYDKLREVLEPDLVASGAEGDKVREGWRKLSYAIATGVIMHVVDHMEITGITTDTNHTQNNGGTGHVS
jgi:hypothetical protein